MGRKYEFQVSDTPSPLKYQPDKAKDFLASRSREAIIRNNKPTYIKPKNMGPGIGKYYDALPKFGANVKNTVLLGTKPQFPLRNSPSRHIYDKERGTYQERLNRLDRLDGQFKANAKHVASFSKPKPGHYFTKLTKKKSIDEAASMKAS